MKISTWKESILIIVTTIRSEGLKAAWIKYRWKLICAITIYYLIRDLTLYVFLPYLAIQLMSN